MPIPAHPKIYHIVHVDRLSSILADGYIWCDAEVNRRSPPGTTIGMSAIKQRRLTLRLASHSGVNVGDCVPFYFCPRSVMLHSIYIKHKDLAYKGGQGPIIHLEADLHQTVAWATANAQRWAFTLSSAASFYFEDRCNLNQLREINWDAVQATYWAPQREPKQAEFLIEQQFPFTLVSRIGVLSRHIYQQVMTTLLGTERKPSVEVLSNWYY